MKWRAQIEEWPLKVPFVISRRSCTTTDVLKLTLERGGITGYGEAAGINYKGETAATLKSTIDQFLTSHTGHLTQATLMEQLPAGGARNALDCALWDLEAKEKNKSIFDLTGAPAAPVQTAFTLSMGSPTNMAKAAVGAKIQPTLKMKLGGEQPLECVQAVRQARPDAEIIVDANEALSLDELKQIAPLLATERISLIEQPLPRSADDALLGYKSPVPLCADESCQTAKDLVHLKDRYEYINIKLDKTGGLTAALELADQAEAMGFGLMVGCMLGTSLAMAPAMVIAPCCRFIDLDGPLLLGGDWEFGLSFDGGTVSPPTRNLWG
jgi:L-alanine-DL-glutamate epimerase-like enolase superfamily enzyme